MIQFAVARLSLPNPREGMTASGSHGQPPSAIAAAHRRRAAVWEPRHARQALRSSGVGIPAGTVGAMPASIASRMVTYR